MSNPGMFDEAGDDYLDPGQEPESQEMDALMDQYLDQMSSTVKPGQLISVPVVAIKADHVLADIGEKSEGIINIREFPQVDGQPQVEVGQTVEVVVKGTDADTGMVSLSHQEARRRAAMTDIREAMEQERPVKGRVVHTVKGGLILDLGTTAFLPASQIDLRRVDNFDEWVGKEVEGLVIEYVPEKRRIVVSRRRLLERERESARREIMGTLEVGQVLDATVKRLTDFGAFVDLGGIDALIPRSEISWQRNARSEDFLAVDEQIQAKVIEIDHEKGKVTLSRKAVQGDPWAEAPGKFPIGATITGNVVSITSYGAFVRLEEGLDGMIHISDMAWDSQGKRPGDFLAQGQEVTAQVLNIDLEGRRISLGMKQLTSDPWASLDQKYPKGKKVKGPVTGLTKYGAFIELEPGIEGMIHVSDFSWDKRINQPRDIVQKGDELEAVVLEVDLERRRVSLGVKQLTESPMESFTRQFKNGDAVEGEITNVTEFGVFVKIGENLEGFMHVSQCGLERTDNPINHFKTGEMLTAKITKIEKGTGKVALSRRAMLRDQERKTVQTYMKQSDKGSLMSMGDLLGDIVLEDDLPARETKPAEPAKPDPAPAAPAPSEPPNPEATEPPAESPSLADEIDEAPGEENPDKPAS